MSYNTERKVSRIFNLFILLLIAYGVSGQTYNMATNNGQTISTTTGNIYDSGGVSGNYSNNENQTLTINVGSGNTARLSFSSYGFETNYDFLHIYYGSSATGTANVVLTGSSSNQVYTSTSQYITLKFLSDYSVTSSGFSATISAVLNCSNITSAGTITGDETGCITYDPSVITSTSTPTGGSGTLQYQWQMNTNGTWTDISGATTNSYNPPTISQTTQYRRGAKRSGCTTFLYSNVVVKTAAGSNVVTNPQMDNGINNWWSWVDGGSGAAGSFNADNTSQLSGANSARVNVTTAANSWNVQFGQDGFNIVAGKQYEILFRAKASANRNIIVSLDSGAPNYTSIVWETQNISTTNQMYYLYFTASQSLANGRLVFNLGGATGTYYIDEVTVRETCLQKERCGDLADFNGNGIPDCTDPACAQIIYNDEFDLGNAGWSLWVDPTASATGSINTGSQLSGMNSYRANISSTSGTDYHVQLTQPNITVFTGKKYVLSFRAFATSPRIITALHQMQQSPWTYSFYKSFNISTTPTLYTVEVIGEETIIDGAFIFNLGASTGTVYIDDIQLTYLCNTTAEICDNNIDDDGDGLIDAADSDCISECPSPTLNFVNPTLISGTSGSNGSIYRFSNVLPGIDGRLTIVGRSHSDISIVSLDEPASTYGGYEGAIQPIIDYNFFNNPGYDPAGDKSISFNLRFVKAGTNTDTTLSIISMTGMDVDGSGEFGQIKEWISSTGYTNYATNSNSVLNISGNLKAQGPYNTFPNISENATEVMVTYNYVGINQINFTYGSYYGGSPTIIDDPLPNSDEKRLNSLYFKCYNLQNEVCGNITSPVVGSGFTRCGEGTLTLTASGCTGGQIQWFTTATGGTAVGAGPTFTTPFLTTTTTYYVECLADGCTSSPREAVTATIQNCTPNEICDNGIDDDGDGLIDFSDPDCGGMCPTGGVLLERWLGITGDNVTALTSNSNFPNNPSETATLTSLDVADNIADFYGTRIRGYIVPSVTGNYLFNITSDDGSELYLSTNGNPTNKVLIASIVGWTNPTEYTKFPSQTSSSLYLEANKNYYFEILHKEGGGGDHLQVSWQTPSNNAWAIIPGANLRPLSCGEICNNGIDDDGDGDIDEEDSDCWTCPNNVTNFQFDNGLNDWFFFENGGSATASVDNTYELSGLSSALIDITTSTGEEWHHQFGQGGHTLEAGKFYEIEFTAKAAASRPISFMMQQGAAPWNTYIYRSYTIDTNKKTFKLKFKSPATNNGNVQIVFNLGATADDVWIDKVFFGETCDPYDICENGIDDDGDGYTDCLDIDCSLIPNGGVEEYLPNYTFSTMLAGNPAEKIASGQSLPDWYAGLSGSCMYYVDDRQGLVNNPEGDFFVWLPQLNDCFVSNLEFAGLGLVHGQTYTIAFNAALWDISLNANCDPDGGSVTQGSGVINLEFSDLNDSVRIVRQYQLPQSTSWANMNWAEYRYTFVYDNTKHKKFLFTNGSAHGLALDKIVLAVGACNVPEVCGNGVDDDQDGSIDGDDPDCFACTGGVLTNPDFTNNMTNWADWGNASIQTETNGNKYVRISNTGGLGQSYTPTVGSTVTLKALGRISESANMVIGISFRDASNNIIGSDISTTVNTVSFSEYTVTGVVPPNTSYMLAFAWRSGSQGIADVDGFCLTEVLAPEPCAQVFMRGVTGTEQVYVKIDGTTVATYTLSTAIAAYDVPGYSTGSVAVEFFNDSGTRDVQVDRIVVNGNTTFQETSASHSNTGCNSGEWLWCNGLLTWSDAILDNCNNGNSPSFDFNCQDGKKIEMSYVGINNALPITYNLGSTTDLDSVRIEIIYKSSNPGASISITDASSNTYTANRMIVGSDAFVYTFVVPPTSSITYSNTTNQAAAQSMTAYKYLGNQIGSAYVSQFTAFGGYLNTQTININVPDRDTVRDITVLVPISEITYDGRSLTVNATMGTVSTSMSRTWGPSGAGFPNGCCIDHFELVLQNVPADENNLIIEVVSPNPGGQSYVLAALINVEIACVDAEICFNGIDDDGDGLIDCADGDCFGACIDMPGYTAVGSYNGSCYYISNATGSWTDFKTNMESLGGHLVTFEDQAEYTAVRSMLPAGNHYAIGLSDAGSEGTWQWVNGSPTSFLNWDTNEPNGGTNENYAYIVSWANGKWHDWTLNPGAKGIMEAPWCAPEICDNGIDDDGDGLTDSFDPDCSCLPTNIPNIDFNNYPNGNSVPSNIDPSEIYASWGIHITTNDPTGHPLKIIDSCNPPSGDLDLGTPNADFGGPGVGAGGGIGKLGENSRALGNVMVISSCPSCYGDYHLGGTITFNFDTPLDVKSFELLDLDYGNIAGTAVAYDNNNNIIVQRNIYSLGDNSYKEVVINALNVSRLEITIPNSFSIASLLFCNDDIPTGSVGDYVWNDSNGDGSQANETGIGNVKVSLYTQNNNLLGETFTNGAGYYSFDYLVDGSYIVKVTPPSGYAATYDLNGGNDNNSGVFTISNGQNRTDIDFGLNNGGVTPPTSCTGNAVTVLSSSGVVNASNALGAPNGGFAQIYEDSDIITLDLVATVGQGDTYSIIWRRKSTYSDNATSEAIIQESADNITWTTHPITPSVTSKTTFETTNITANVDTRYLRISILTNTGDDIDLDAIVFTCPEICDNGIDDDGDGLIDCLDPKCQGDISISNLTVGSCIDQPLADIADMTFTVSWSNPPTGQNLILTYENKKIVIPSGTSSPQTYTVQVAADGIQKNVSLRWSGNICDVLFPYTPPSACSNDELSCNILYLCGLDKPYDGDAYDHGVIEYILANNGGSTLLPILTKNEAGMGTYDPMDANVFIPVNLADFDMVIISPTTEGHMATSLINALKTFSGGLLNGNYLIQDELGMTNGATEGVNWGNNAYLNNTTSTQILRYDNPGSWYSPLTTHGDPLPSADQYMWASAGDQLAGQNAIIYKYDPSDVLPGVTAHGPRVYSGFHMNGIYANGQNNGALPSPPEVWFNPVTHLTKAGKQMFDMALILAGTNCIPEVCTDGKDNDLDGFTDCNDTECTPTLSSADSVIICQSFSTPLSVTVTGGTGPFTYSWSPSTGLNNASIANPIANPNTTTTYIVTVTSASGCTATTSRRVVVRARPSASIAGPSLVCYGSTGTLTASGGGTYLWNTNETTNSISIAPTASTTYRVTVTAINGCTRVASKVVAPANTPTVTINKNGFNCLSDNAAFTATAAGGSGVYTYAWSGPFGFTANTATIDVDTSGTYTVVITDGNGCQASANASINGRFNPTVSAPSSSVCQGTPISLTASGANIASYLWSANAGNATTASVTVSPNTNSTYSVTVTNNQSCVASASQQINVITKPSIGLPGKTSLCEGETTTITASGAGTWTSSNTNIATINNSGLITAVSAGRVKFLFTNSSTLCVSDSSAEVIVNPKPQYMITGPSAICVGSNTTLSPTTGGTWTSSNPSVASVTSGGVVTGVSEGIAKFIFVNTATQCSSDSTTAIVVDEKKGASINGPDTLCVGEAANLSATRGGGAWSVNAPAIASLSGNTITGVSQGLATVTYTYSSGACGNTTTKPVQVISLPQATISKVDASCGLDNGSISFNFGNDASQSTLKLSINNGATFVEVPDSIGNYTFSALSAGTYTPIVEWSDGKCETSFANVVIAQTNPAPIVTFSSTNEACGSNLGGSITFNITNDPNRTQLQLSINGGVTFPYFVNDNVGAFTIASLLPGTYNLAVKWTDNTCEKSIGTAIISSGDDTGGSVTSPSTICLGSSKTLSATGGIAYLWSTGANTASISVTPNALTNYQVTISLANGCSTVKTTNVNVSQDIALTPVYDNGRCLTPSASIQINHTGGLAPYTYQWSGPGGFSQTTKTVSVSQSGNYLVTVTDANGCKNSMAAAMQDPYTPVATASDTEICSGDIIILDVNSSSAVSYQWSANAGNSTSKQVSVTPSLPSVTYLVTVTNDIGCIATSSVNVTVHESPTISLSGPDSICVGSTVNVTASTTIGFWSSTNESVATVNNAGIVTASGEGSTILNFTETTYFCNSEQSIPIFVSGDSIQGLPKGTMCVGDTIYLTSPFTGSWASNSSNVSVTPQGRVIGLSGGLVSLSFSRSDIGCTLHNRTKLLVNPRPSISFNGVDAICVGSTTTIEPTTGGTWTSTNSNIASITTNGLVTGQNPGITYFTFTNASTGCVSDLSAPFEVTERIVPSINGPDTICTGANTFFLPNTGGVWQSTNPTIASITSNGYVTGHQAGEARFIFIKAGGVCISDTSEKVLVLPRPNISLTGEDEICTGSNTYLNPTSGGVWTSNDPTIASVNNQGVVTGLSAGTATFTFTSNTHICESAASIPVTVFGSPDLSVNGNDTICLGSNAVLSPAGAGTWISSNSSIATASSNGIVSTYTPGRVSFKYIENLSNCLSADSVWITILPLPNAVFTGPTTLCVGDSSTVTPNTGGAWVSSNNAVATITASGKIIAVGQGIAKFRFTTNFGCSSDWSGNIIVNAKPNPILIGTPDLCVGDTKNILPSSGGTWVSSNPNIATITNAGLITGIAGGIVSFVFTDNLTGCVSGASSNITVNNLPPINVPPGQEICVGGTLNVAPTFGGTWYSENTNIATITNTGLITGINPGSVRFYFIKTETNCESSLSNEVIIKPKPIPTFAGPTQICVGDTTNITTSEPGTWISSAPNVASINSQGVIIGRAAGIARFRFTSTSGACISDLSSSLLVNGQPTISLSGLQDICIGNTTSLLPNAGGTWSSTNPSVAIVSQAGVVSGLSSGTSFFKFVESNTGCKSKDSIRINVYDNPTLSLNGDKEVCIGITRQALSSTNGSWYSANPKIATVSASGLIKGVAPGKVQVYFIDALTGCEYSTSDLIIEVVKCINPDFNVITVNDIVTGDLSTNDNNPSGAVYQHFPLLVSKPSSSIYDLFVNEDGTYSFRANKPGKYQFNAQVCAPPLTFGCPSTALEFTVLGDAFSSEIPVNNIEFMTVKSNVDLNQPSNIMTMDMVANDKCVNVFGCDLDTTLTYMTKLPSAGTMTASNANWYKYQSNPSYIGYDTVSYNVCNSTGCSVSNSYITVAANNASNTVTASDDFAYTTKGVTVNENVLLNDTDAEGDIITIIEEGSQFSPIVIDEGTYFINNDGTISFTPDSDFTGPVDIVYTVCDDNANSACMKATLHILVFGDLSLKIRVYLEGALSNNEDKLSTSGKPLMRDDLRRNPFNGLNYIPLNDPYTYGVGIFGSGTETHVGPGSLTEYTTIADSAAVFSVDGQDAIVDWVFVELRDKTDNATVIATRSGLVQRDGDVVDLDGVSDLRFTGVGVDSFYVVIRHRNHLGLMSTLVSNIDLIDFTSPTFNTLSYSNHYTGNNYTGLQANFWVKNGYAALWAGDFNSDGKIKFAGNANDLNTLATELLTYPTNTDFKANFDFGYGYFQGDYNLNGKIKYTNPNDDTNMLFTQVLLYALNVAYGSNYDSFIEQVVPRSN